MILIIVAEMLMNGPLHTLNEGDITISVIEAITLAVGYNEVIVVLLNRKK
ncbi:hypothetical protein [Geomicrobium sp. JCM 19055]|nr:hypothetical protein [Geomicrobium sp. JCM 19055]